MGILKRTTTSRVVPMSFADKLTAVKEVFKKAYENAEALNEEIKADIQAKTVKIEILQTQLAESEKAKSETQNFMKNLEKFI